ncbi:MULTISPECIES: DUF3343 domain-containing protein [unclassified Sedimentibacter]|uniref:DUF3343 domain-containing protein n=1 Tax=unclassified Sedimentibacter TaxID=2649220 RepID=UPI0027E05C32|nr:DUF3343 domain-containing protein [Sedimentibacter sp. MB35-C1]WMJ78137.1 DUF3343 domain-containing protein [Sedimentibacter sp. MB35-C1]
MDQYNYMTFKSVSYAMKVETEVKKHDIEYKVIPVPRSISSSCGICIRFFKSDMNKMKDIIENNKLVYDNIYLSA